MTQSSKSQDLVYELLLVSTGSRKGLQRTYSDNDWKGTLAIAHDQAIVGVLLSSIEALDVQPPKPLLLQWIGLVQLQEQECERMARAGATAVNYFQEHGFSCQILKGSAVARYYPQPQRRSSGDLDIWVDGGRKKIYDFARAFDKDGKLYGVNYHHIHFHLIENVHIEVHIWPSFLSSPLRNRRFHQFCNLHRPTMDASMPCLAFDRVFILLHCYRHFCGSGIGLRHIMDYYYILNQGFTEEERVDAEKWIRRLGMGKFAEGMVWTLRELFGLEKKKMIVKPNEQEGRFILKEVMLTGNMGRIDTRNWGKRNTAISRFFHNIRRDFYMAGHYPVEALWQPLFSIGLYSWRFCKGFQKVKDGD